MSDPQTWRELLGQIIENPREKQRLAGELGIRPITLTRWAHEKIRPRLSNLLLLVKALPKHRKQLIDLIPKEFPEFTAMALVVEDSPKEVPASFYAQVLNALADLPQVVRFASVCDLILQQALEQLDPNRVGMEITIARCMPPSPLNGNMIRSLREDLGRGTHPWERELTEKTMFLGAEALAGYVVTFGRARAIQNHEEGQLWFPAHWVEGEESAAACPILRGGHIIGCLLISCTEPNYFLPSRLTLLQNYANLVMLTFEREEFYALDCVALRIMPSYEMQLSHFANFKRRVSDTMVQALRNRQPITVLQAEQLVWQQIEEELIQLAPQPDTGA